MPEISAVESPEAATAAAESVLTTAHGDTVKPPPEAAELPSDLVILPGGYLDLFQGVLITDAHVRELNGEDEEAISKTAESPARYFDTILSRGVETIGDSLKVTKDVLNRLLAGDRDALLLGIRCVTFGEVVDYFAFCPHCRTEQSVSVNLRTDIPVDKLEDPVSGRSFEVDLPSGKKAQVSLPDGSASAAMANSTDKTESALKTVLLQHTVKEIDGFPVVNADAVRKNLSIQDRNKIIEELNERNPGPQLGEVSRPCEDCEGDIPVIVNMADLFRF